MTSPLIGLSQAEVDNRRARGEGNNVDNHQQRTYTDLARANLFTFFNNILYVIGFLLIALGQTNDALFSVGLGVFNAIIGTIQEIRSKQKLDKIALLTRPEVTVLRDSQEQVIDPSELVKGDIIHLQVGDQVVVDGHVVSNGRLEMDESLLTGEPDLVPKNRDDNLLSGSFCVSGNAYYQADKVGADSFANQLTATARTFQISYTPLQRQVTSVVSLLMLIVGIMSLVIFVAAILDDLSFARLVQIAAVLTGLVPYGMFTMIVVAYALGAVKIANQGALMQQTNAIESLSNIDVLCMDKTGTLTANKLRFHSLETIGDTPLQFAHQALGDFAHSQTSGNQTTNALQAGLEGNLLTPVAEVPFVSARKWSAFAFDAPTRKGVFVLGAVEMLRPYLPDEHFPADSRLSTAVKAASDQGLRVLLFAFNPQTTTLYHEDTPTLPKLTPLAIVSLSDQLRPHVKETLAIFTELGINLKIISGDNPHTVSALVKQAGLIHDFELVSGPELAEMSEAEFGQKAAEATVFGRITPEQKEHLVSALREQGHYVAMMGDGVNDVLSLKKANLGIAMQSGSQATRNVADMILLNDSFGALHPAFTEGQKIVSGLTSSLYLFLVRVVTSTLIIIAITMIGLGFPFEPAQVALTLFTVGIPTFFLTLWARPQNKQENIFWSLTRFVVPSAILTLLFGIFIYSVMNSLVLNVNNFSFWGADEVEMPARLTKMFEEYTGLSYNVDDSFSEAVAALISAQSMLSVFISYVAFVLILFLEPPFAWFAVWNKQSDDKRPLWLTIGLCFIFTLIIFNQDASSYFGILTMRWQPMMAIVVAVISWTFILRHMWQTNWFEKVLRMDIVDE